MAWTFDTTNQAWTGTWTGAHGSPAPGCLLASLGDDGPPVVQSPAAVSCVSDAPFSCRVRIVATSTAGLDGWYQAYMSLGPLLGPRYGLFLTAEIDVLDGVSYDSGWFIIDGISTGVGTNFAIVIGTTLSNIATLDFYVDTVHVGDVGPPLETFEYIHSSGGIPGSVMI